jgi:hypothetical protein
MYIHHIESMTPPETETMSKSFLRAIICLLSVLVVLVNVFLGSNSNDQHILFANNDGPVVKSVTSINSGIVGPKEAKDDSLESIARVVKTNWAQALQESFQYQYVVSPSNLSPACRPTWGDRDGSMIRRIFFSHTRKAGGSYLKRLFKLSAKLHNWTFEAAEGTPVEEPRRNDTLYLTNLRHPVGRTISNYKYEGRWDCIKMIHNESFVPTAENSQTLEAYIDDPYQKPKCGQRYPLCWECSELCYLRLFGAEFNCLENITRSYATAMERLSQFHLIVVTEQLSSNKYRQGLLGMFGLNPNMTICKGMFCYSVSKVNNELHPATIRNETLKRLYDNNRPDIHLYDTLTRCPDGVVFPSPLYG